MLALGIQLTQSKSYLAIIIITIKNLSKTYPIALDSKSGVYDSCTNYWNLWRFSFHWSYFRASWCKVTRFIQVCNWKDVLQMTHQLNKNNIFFRSHLMTNLFWFSNFRMKTLVKKGKRKTKVWNFINCKMLIESENFYDSKRQSERRVEWLW